MYNKLVYLMALLLLLTVSVRIVGNLRHVNRTLKASIEVSDKDESKSEKSENENGKELSFWVNQAFNSPGPIVLHQNQYLSLKNHPTLPKRHCSVPTPPPWA